MSTRSTDHHQWQHDEQPTSGTVTDRGYTLIEMLIVVLILGTLLGGAILAVGGISTEAAGTGCDADRRQLGVAIGSYEAQTGDTTIAPTPATGTDHDRFERTLVEDGFLGTVSEYHDIDATGTITPQEGSSC